VSRDRLLTREELSRRLAAGDAANLEGHVVSGQCSSFILTTPLLLLAMSVHIIE